MTWTYEQDTGRLFYDGLCMATGYAGSEEGKNNPAMEGVKNVGPLPRGKYMIESPINTRTHGPYVLSLAPNPENQMFGRSHFLIHGDSLVNPGTASEGCIIMPRTVRERIWESGDHDLEVV